jgi:hypothetical protein
MGLLPPQLSFPEPGTYLRYYSATTREMEFLRLMEREAPLIYPRRLSATDPGGDTATLILDEVNPSRSKKHRYMAYIGVAPGALYTIYHPYSSKRLEWDISVVEIDKEQTAALRWEESPYEAATFFVWIEPDGHPAVQARNLLDVSSHPAVLVTAAKYAVKEMSDLSPEEKKALLQGVISCIPVSFGGGF